jgi:hypothetical protein
VIQNVFGRNSLKRLLRLPYSFDISPSDFYLFEKAKSALIDLLQAVTKILNDISDADL